jgi:hypothetical protein
MAGSELKTSSFQQIRRQAQCRARSTPRSSPTNPFCQFPTHQSPDGEPGIPPGPLTRRPYLLPTGTVSLRRTALGARSVGAGITLIAHQAIFLRLAEQNYTFLHPMYAPVGCAQQSPLDFIHNIRF